MNPDIVDNNQIFLVETDVYSLDSSLERAVQAAGNIPSSIMYTVSTTMEEVEVVQEVVVLEEGEMLPIRLDISVTIQPVGFAST